MYCRNCGKEIPENAVICTHCGVQVKNFVVSPQVAATQISAKKEENSIAIVGFVLSFFVPLAGLICSIIGYSKAVKHNGDFRGLALAGLIISIVMLALQMMIVFVYISILFPWFIFWGALFTA